MCSSGGQPSQHSEVPSAEHALTSAALVSASGEASTTLSTKEDITKPSTIHSVTSSISADLRHLRTASADLQLHKDQSSKPPKKELVALPTRPSPGTAQFLKSSGPPGRLLGGQPPTARHLSAAVSLQTQEPSVVPIKNLAAHAAPGSIIREMVTATGTGCMEILGLTSVNKPRAAAKVAWRTK